MEAVSAGLGVGRVVELPRPRDRPLRRLRHHRRRGRRAAPPAADRAGGRFRPQARGIAFIAGLLAPAALAAAGPALPRLVEGRGGQGVRGRRRPDRASHADAGAGIDQHSFVFNGVEMPLRPNIGLYTQPITLVGLPVVAAPVQLPGGLPTAVQLIGRPGSKRPCCASRGNSNDARPCRTLHPIT